MRTLLQPLLSYLDWATTLRPAPLSFIALGGPVLVVAAAVWFLFVGGGNDPTTANSQQCAGYSSQAARDYCNGVTEGDVLDCTDFASAIEARSFALVHDQEDINKLQQPAGSGTYCADLAAASTQTPPGTTGSTPPTPTVQPIPTATPPPSTYTVVSGDNPTLIARKVGVPPEDVDAWVVEMLALNGVDATALQIGQELILPPIGGDGQATANGGNPANTGGSSGSVSPTSSAGGTTANPTNTPVPPTVAHGATATPPAPASTTAAATATATTAAAATATTAPAATNSPAPTTTSSQCTGSAQFNIDQTTVSPGGQVSYSGSNFTANDATTATLTYEGTYSFSDVGPTIDASGGFSGNDTIPSDAPTGTYSLTIMDAHGKCATDSVVVK